MEWSCPWDVAFMFYSSATTKTAAMTHADLVVVVASASLPDEDFVCLASLPTCSAHGLPLIALALPAAGVTTDHGVQPEAAVGPADGDVRHRGTPEKEMEPATEQVLAIAAVIQQKSEKAYQVSVTNEATSSVPSLKKIQKTVLGDIFSKSTKTKILRNHPETCNKQVVPKL
ncbi:hypothetical protein ABZP36_032103 [Zizania latifolia]